MQYLWIGDERGNNGMQRSQNEGFFTIVGLVILMYFLSFATILQLRCDALLQLSYAQERVDAYVYLLTYIKEECRKDSQEMSESEIDQHEWYLLCGTNSYRIFWEEDNYAAYQGMHCILRVYINETGGIEHVLFGEYADI